VRVRRQSSRRGEGLAVPVRRLASRVRRRWSPDPKRAGRLRFLRANVDLEGVRALEVGPLDEPLLAGVRGVSVEYLDRCSREEHARRHAGHPRRDPRRFVAPTYVVEDKRFAAAVDGSFDLVIANHVLEHVADPITWLQEVDRLVVPGGAVFLALPDRRFSFDYLRPVSTVADLVRAHRADLERPDFTQVLEATYYARPLRPPDFAHGSPPRDKLARGRFSSLAAAIESAEARVSDYADVHCHVFESGRFPILVDDLRSGGLVPWHVTALDDVEPGRLEFRAILRRASEPQAA
jgi:SAM-dependent methyltransferase